MVESDHGENYDGRCEQFTGHAEPEQNLGIPDIVGSSRGVFLARSARLGHKEGQMGRADMIGNIREPRPWIVF